MFIAAKTAHDCEVAVADTVELFSKLGFVANVEKSHMTPSQSLEHLGFRIDTVTMLASITADKVQRLTDRAGPLIQKPTLRQVMQFIGTTGSCKPGVRTAYMHKYHLEVEKNAALKRFGGKLHKRFHLSDKALCQVQWWVLQAVHDPRPLVSPTVSVQLQTDASSRGWGACVVQHAAKTGLRTKGAWSVREGTAH